jgi:hypothetical protein
MKANYPFVACYVVNQLYINLFPIPIFRISLPTKHSGFDRFFPLNQTSHQPVGRNRSNC